jgi:hypothetical protein
MRVLPSIVIAAILASTITVLSQSLPIVTTSTKTSANGMLTLEIQNNYREPITAYAYDASFLSQGINSGLAEKMYDFRFIDAVADPKWKPVQSGGHTFTALAIHGSGVISNVNIVLRAAVFSDGHAFGDPEWIKRIIKRRHNIRDELVRIDEILQRAIINVAEISSIEDQAKADEAQRIKIAQGDFDQIRPIYEMWYPAFRILDAAQRNTEQAVELLISYRNKMREIREALDQALSIRRN